MKLRLSYSKSGSSMKAGQKGKMISRTALLSGIPNEA